MSKIVVVKSICEDVYETDIDYSQFVNQMQNVNNGYVSTISFCDKHGTYICVNLNQVAVIKFIEEGRAR